MTNTIAELIENRSSIGRYDTERQMSDEQVNELVRLATLSPSAFNIQNWRFIAVRSDEAKQKLLEVSYGQQKVADASVTFIVCGLTEAYGDLPAALQPSVDAGIINQSLVADWTAMMTESQQGNPQAQRDEAIRTASLASMTMMLAAEGMGLGSGAMTGFDMEGLVEAFELSPREIPVMLVTVGYPAANNWPQKHRLPVEQVMTTV